MKTKFKYILIFLLFFTSLQTFATEIKVLKIYDGDSILAKINDNIFRIRLIVIDCFEGTNSNRASYQAQKYNLSQNEIVKGGNIAKNILKKELKNKKTTFEFQGIDKYNRALGIIYANNENINEKMLNTPYCKIYNYKAK